MDIQKDKLVDGPFGSNACYESSFDSNGQTVTTWLCFGSGYTSSTLMVKGSEVVKAALDTSPELYKDLMHEDKDGKIWMPATITLPGKGMVFADGSNKKDWKWAAVKSIQLTEEEIKSKRYPKGQTQKMDMKNSQKFEQNLFMDALEVIGFYED